MLVAFLLLISMLRHFSMSSKLESTIQSRNTGQRILNFDRCQLTITLMSSFKEGHYKLRLYVSAGAHHC